MVSSAKQSGLSRRDFLKGISIGTLGLGVGGWLGSRAIITRAQDGSTANVAAFYRFMVGDMRVTAIQDGAAGFPPDFYAVNAEPGSVAAVMEESNVPVPPAIAAPIIVLLVEDGERKILLDTGLGSITLAPDAPPPGGKLLPTLALLGVSNDAVTDVVISHFHPDHIAAVSDTQTATFPNAAYYFPQA
jgi:glyoxylase-like metal-dependent hydrolase (beta-lactamase superfamily II)